MIYSYRDDEAARINAALESRDLRDCIEVLASMFFAGGEVKQLINIIRDSIVVADGAILNPIAAPPDLDGWRTVEPDTCGYCGSPYTIATAGCAIKCPNSMRAAAFVTSVFERADLP